MSVPSKRAQSAIARNKLRDGCELRSCGGDIPTVTAVGAWCLLLIAFGQYLPSLRFSFLRDDRWQIVNNPQVQSWSFLPQLFSTHLWSQSGTEHAVHFYRPVFSLWILILNTIGGTSPVWWHSSCIFLHAVTTLTVYKLCEKLLENKVAALLAALLFAVHPIHVDAVSWVSASNEILFTLLIIAAILVLVWADDAPATLRPLQLGTSAAFYGAALLVKETAIAVGPVLLLIVLLKGKERKRVFQAGLWYLCVTIMYCAMRWWALQRIGIEESKHTWQEVLFSSPSVVIFYLKKLLLPIGLSGFYTNPIISSATISVWLTAGALLTASGLVVWFAFRLSRVLGIAASLVVFPLLPALLAIRIYDQGDMTHDRYLYLPSVGLCLFFGLLVRQVWSSSKLSRAGVATASSLLFVVFGYLTFQQQSFYRNNEAFYQRAIDLDPANIYVIDSFGAIHLENGETERAMKEFRTAFQLAPNDANAVYGLARGLFETHQYAESEPLFRQASKSPVLDSKRKAILLALADVEINLGKLFDAEQVLGELETLDSGFPSLHRTLGILFQKEGRIGEAQLEYHREFQVSGDMQAELQAIALREALSSH